MTNKIKNSFIATGLPNEDATGFEGAGMKMKV